MQKLTASNLVAFIGQLDRNVAYNYINPRNRGLIRITSIDHPQGPIRIKRWDPSRGGTSETAREESISVEMIWRVANALFDSKPINLDRVLAGSYNTRSVLESLLAHSPQFYYCRPGRIENLGGNSSIREGHKHLVWLPNQPHKIGVLQEYESSIVISEVPQNDAYYDSIATPSDSNSNLDIEIQRRHAQIQIALYFIGKQLNYRTWIAQNDKGIVYNNKKIGELDGVIARLQDEKLLVSYQDAARAAAMIDCIWFKNGRLMPAVMEIEHSTGVTSGLTRMQNFKQNFIPLQNVRYVIVASDEDRAKVFKEASKPQFKDLDTKYFSYSAVEELYALCQRRKITGVSEEFLDSFMESILN